MLRRKGIKKILEESYVSWVDMSFGEELVNFLYLCFMNKKKEKDGFYKCEVIVIFNDVVNEFVFIEIGNIIGEGDEV